MITPYKYRYTLGRDTFRTPTGAYIVFHEGRRVEIHNSTVEFQSTKKLTFLEFQEKIKGTEGITGIYGEFLDDQAWIKELIDKYDELVEECMYGDFADEDTVERLSSEIKELKKKYLNE